MPLYEYQCESCSHRFERIQKFSDPPADTCPQCSGKVRKLISCGSNAEGWAHYAEEMMWEAGLGDGDPAVQACPHLVRGVRPPPAFRASAPIRSIRSRASRGASPAEGSSQSSRVGRVASAAARQDIEHQIDLGVAANANVAIDSASAGS